MPDILFPRSRHGRRTAFLGVRPIGPIRHSNVAENPQPADESAVPSRCFLTVQRGARSLPALEADVMSTLFSFILIVASVAIFMAHMIDAIRS